ncbi:MAG TPA: aquaporin [Anaerolineales bacterium]|jgi:MIP family channel proteins|nr:aquaporin [Anaerolineales bacterium]
MNTKALLAEFVGTFALIFVGAGTAAVGVGGLIGVALAHGIVLVSMVYAYGGISGAHVNPAVTLAVALRGNLSWGQTLGYWIAQFAGGIVGAGSVLFVLGGASSGLGATVPAAGVSPLQAIVLEGLLTFLFVNVILHTTEGKSPSPFAGLAIGLTLAGMILFGGPLTGASLNPARTLGPALFTNNLGVVWIYLVGPAAGSILAVFVRRALK